MKIKIILAFLAMIITGSLKAQKIKLNEKVSIQPPSNSEKLTTSGVKSLATAKGIKTLDLPNTDGKYSFVQDDVIVTLIPSKKEEKVNLTMLKKGLDGMAQNKDNGSRKILSAGDKQYLVVENPWESKIWIYCTNATGSTLVNGVLEFKEENRSRAKSLVETVVRNIDLK